jgi:dihydrolipoamide dehydrogenase
VIVDEHFRTTQPNIYAIGDLIKGPKQAHRASLEGVLVAEIIAGKPVSIDYMSIPSVIYTNPELASVGITEEAALERKIPYKKGICTFREAGAFEGMVKVLADAKTDQLIGMHILASQASDLIAIGSLAMAKKATLSELGALPFAHPTYGEAIKEACLKAGS